MTRDASLSVILVDDHRMFIEGLAMLLDKDRRVHVVGIASSPSGAISLAAEHAPDVVLLDVDLNDQPAGRTIRQLLRVLPSVCIVMLTMHTYRPLLDSLVRAGARGCLNKSLSARELVSAVIEIVAGAPAPQDPKQPDSPLTRRELEVLRLVGLALSNREISHQLAISEGTVKRHLHEVNVKLDAVNRLDAVRKAEKIGLLR